MSGQLIWLNYILKCFRRELFFSSQWTTAIEKSKISLDPDDLETVETFRSWGDVQELVLDGVSPSIALIRPALGHLSIFADFFETKLGPDLDASFIWGALACLLQASNPGNWHWGSKFPTQLNWHALQLAAEDTETLGKIPRMLKSLAHKAEAFNGYCNEVQVVGNPVKEACFDMQVLFVDFFIASINYIHGAGEVPRHSM